MNDDYELEDFAPWIVVGLTLAGAFLRALYLGEKGMWLDETFSVWMANHSIPDMLQWIAKIDQHPPLYYLLLHFWTAVNGDSPYYARGLSALFGAATIPVIYLIGKRLSGVIVGLAAAAFLTFSPFNIFYGQETRMYTLLAFNAAVAIYALTRLLTDVRAVVPIGRQLREYVHVWRTAGPVEPVDKTDLHYKAMLAQTGLRGWIYHHRWSSIRTIETDLAWITLIVFSVATMLTHNTAVFFILAINLFVLGLLLVQRIRKSVTPFALRPPSLANWVKAQIATFLLWCPWVVIFFQQVRNVDQQFWIPQPTWDIVARALRSFVNPSGPNQVGQDAVIWILCGLLVLGVVYYRKKLSIFVFLATLFAVPFLGELIVSLRRPIFYDRTLIWITIPLLLLLAAGIAQLRFRLLMLLVVGLIATNYMFTAGDYYTFFRKEDWYTAAGYVANSAQKGDLVLFNSNFVVVAFDYYFAPFEDKYALKVDKQGVPLDLYKDAVLEPKMTEADIPKLTELVSGRDRVWLVYSHDSYTDPKGLIPQTLAAEKKLLLSREFYGGKVQLYGTP